MLPSALCGSGSLSPVAQCALLTWEWTGNRPDNAGALHILPLPAWCTHTLNPVLGLTHNHRQSDNDMTVAASHTCTSRHTQPRTHTHSHTRTHLLIQPHTQIHTQTHTQRRAHRHTHTHTYKHTHTPTHLLFKSNSSCHGVREGQADSRGICLTDDC